MYLLSVGVGNTIVFFIISLILTTIVLVVGSLLSLIPYIGTFFYIISRIATIVWWILLIVMCIKDYGIGDVMLALAGLIILLIFLFRGEGLEGIIFFWK